MLYLFEDYALDTGRRELRRGDHLLAVEPKVFDLLVHLVGNRDRVVGKDDLIETVWGGRIVSESALTSCINAARTALGDSGEAQRLIKTLPRKGVRFVGDVKEGSHAARTAPPAAPEPAGSAERVLPDKPSVAVLPFTSMSPEPGDAYFSDGVVEEIITALSQTGWLFVIARNSSFTYQGQAVDVQQAGRELGVRYLLTGSVRKAANRVRIGVQLVEAATRAHIWADQFDGTLDDIFDVQDQVTRKVIGAIVPKLEDAEIARAKRKVTANLNAYDYYLRALAAFHRKTREGNGEAVSLIHKAIALDPHFASAFALGAYCYSQRKNFGWMTDSIREVAEAAALARQAADQGRNDPVALALAGQVLVFVAQDLDTGAAMIDRALALNPNQTLALHWSGWVKTWLGDPEAGIERLATAMRLSPLDPSTPMMQDAIAHGHFFASRHDEAAAWAARSLATLPAFHSTLRISAAGNAFAGNLEQARLAVERLRRIDPSLRVSNLPGVLGPYRRADFVAKYQEGLRRAGLPE